MDPAIKDQIIGMLRIAIPLGLTLLVSQGWISVEQQGQYAESALKLAVAVIDLAALVWSFNAHKQEAQIARVSKMQGVKQVVLEDKPNRWSLKLRASPNITTK